MFLRRVSTFHWATRLLFFVSFLLSESVLGNSLNSRNSICKQIIKIVIVRYKKIIGEVVSVPVVQHQESCRGSRGARYCREREAWEASSWTCARQRRRSMPSTVSHTVPWQPCTKWIWPGMTRTARWSWTRCNKSQVIMNDFIILPNQSEIYRFNFKGPWNPSQTWTYFIQKGETLIISNVFSQSLND